MAIDFDAIREEIRAKDAPLNDLAITLDELWHFIGTTNKNPQSWRKEHIQKVERYSRKLQSVFSRMEST